MLIGIGHRDYPDWLQGHPPDAPLLDLKCVLTDVVSTTAVSRAESHADNYHLDQSALRLLCQSAAATTRSFTSRAKLRYWLCKIFVNWYSMFHG
jgi:hypothetical protein